MEYLIFLKTIHFICEKLSVYVLTSRTTGKKNDVDVLTPRAIGLGLYQNVEGGKMIFTATLKTHRSFIFHFSFKK